MKLPPVLLVTAWIAAALAAIVAWGIMAFATCLMFLVGYGSPAGVSAGQAQIQLNDRQAAWLFLIILVELSVLVVFVVWPASRRRRRARGISRSEQA